MGTEREKLDGATESKREKLYLLKCVTCQSFVTSKALSSEAVGLVCLSRLPPCHSFRLLAYCKEEGNKRQWEARTAIIQSNPFFCLSGKDFQAVATILLISVLQLGCLFVFRLLAFVLTCL